MMPARRDARAATAAKPRESGQPGGRESGRIRLKRALERDRGILARLDAGETVRQVAAAEGVSIRTVYNALKRRDQPRPPKLVQGWLSGMSRVSTRAPDESPPPPRIPPATRETREDDPPRAGLAAGIQR